jgi:hypothetical protein
MILVKAAAGLVIELSAGPLGLFDSLSVKLAEGLSARALTFEVKESARGRLMVRPAEERELAELMLFLGAIATNEGQILAEVRKYQPAGG